MRRIRNNNLEIRIAGILVPIRLVSVVDRERRWPKRTRLWERECDLPTIFVPLDKQACEVRDEDSRHEIAVEIWCPQSLRQVAPLTKKPEDSGYEIGIFRVWATFSVQCFVSFKRFRLANQVSFRFVSQSQTLEEFVVVCDPYFLGPYRLGFKLLGSKGGGSPSLSVAVMARQKVVFAQGTTGFPWFYIAEIASVYLHVSWLTMQYQREKSPNKAEQHN